MVNDVHRVVWTDRAHTQLKKAYYYIHADSPKNALRVAMDIVRAVHKAAPNPEIYPADKLRIDNDGSYRAFELHRYRVAYRFSKGIIRVLRVRHTSREPLSY